MKDGIEFHQIFNERYILALLFNWRHLTHIPTFHNVNLRHCEDRFSSETFIDAMTK